MSRFDRDTAVEDLGDGRFGAEIHAAWNIVRGPNGGYLAAIVLRALRAAAADPDRAPRSLTIHYLAAPGPGPVEVGTRVERTGSRLTTVSGRMEQDGATVALALAAFSANWDQALPDTAPVMPDAPPPDGREPFPRIPGRTPPFSDHFVMTPTVGTLPFAGGDEARTGGWLRLEDPRAVDPVLLATYADAWFPAPFSRLTGPAAAPTIDLTIHFRTADPAVAAGEPVLAVF
ncbi:MAG TPA: thioesterase family protein, partial [Solirubrobacteraceae bacterium]|nr:thioesterase family protein [Solirubrobacteraceae bacterium]